MVQNGSELQKIARLTMVVQCLVQHVLSAWVVPPRVGATALEMVWVYRYGQGHGDDTCRTPWVILLQAPVFSRPCNRNYQTVPLLQPT